MNRNNLIWGVVLLLVGGFLLAVNLGIVPIMNANLIAALFISGGILFLGAYFANGIDQWGWLFPATALLAVGATIWFSESGFDGEWIGAMFMIAVAVPFWVAYLTNRENWWALIPGGLMTMVAVLVAGTTTRIAEEIWVALMLAGFGVVFLLVYYSRQDNWWAIIPGGSFLGIGATVLFAGMDLPGPLETRLAGGSFMLILGLTFGALWLLREKHGTKWAKYPAVAVGSIGALVMVIGESVEYVWPLILIGVGAWLLWRGRIRV
jgi:hypothetical protein